MDIARHNSAVLLTRTATLFLVWVLALIIPTDVLAQGCAMCQTVMPHGSDPMARGMFWGVLLLMSAPFAVGASIGGWLWYKYRQAQRTSRATAPVFPLHLAYSQKED